MSASDEFEALIEDAENNGIDTNSPGIKSLRKAYDKLKAETAQLRTTVQEHSAASRTSSLASALEKFSAKPALAKYFPKDGDVTEEAVLTWLKADGELFGWEQPAASENVSDEDVAAARAVASLQPNPAGNSTQARAAALGSTPMLGKDITQADAMAAKTLADQLLSQINLL